MYIEIYQILTGYKMRCYDMYYVGVIDSTITIFAIYGAKVLIFSEVVKTGFHRCCQSRTSCEDLSAFFR